MLDIREVSFRYDADAPLLRYMMQAGAGEITAVTGESGSGKSTLLDLIAGFLRPLSGEIVLEERRIDTLAPDKRGVAILFQRHNLFEHLTVAQNLALARKGISAEEIAAILDEVGLQGLEKRRASELSGGQAQRVALARTLLSDARAVLLDEPFSALDSKTKAEMLTLVETMTKRHRWHTVMVTHDEADAALAARRYRMQEGVLREA